MTRGGGSVPLLTQRECRNDSSKEQVVRVRAPGAGPVGTFSHGQVWHWARSPWGSCSQRSPPWPRRADARRRLAEAALSASCPPRNLLIHEWRALAARSVRHKPLLNETAWARTSRVGPDGSTAHRHVGQPGFAPLGWFGGFRLPTRGEWCVGQCAAAHTAKRIDDLCLVRSIHTDAINHDPAITFSSNGFPDCRASIGRVVAQLRLGIRQRESARRSA